MYLAFVSMVNFQFLVQFPVDLLPYLVVPSLVLLLSKFTVFAHNSASSSHHLHMLFSVISSFKYYWSLGSCYVLPLEGILRFFFPSHVQVLLYAISTIFLLKYPCSCFFFSFRLSSFCCFSVDFLCCQFCY